MRLSAPALVLGVALVGAASVASVAPASAESPRRDPNGRTGLSPAMELVLKGEAAFATKDFEGAILKFQEAAKADKEKKLAPLRLAEAQLAAGKIADAEATVKDGLSKRGGEEHHAKLLFLAADLKERQGKWTEAKDAWVAYATYLQNTPKALGSPATSTERQVRLEKRVQDEKDYGFVKERIAKRIAEKEAEAAENAKNDKLNR